MLCPEHEKEGNKRDLISHYETGFRSETCKVTEMRQLDPRPGMVLIYQKRMHPFYKYLGQS